ncbi:formylglycine-generating enzyme family protein [Dryocola sp. BD626]|uniref:formylglycine-generating enzyme family protein n=1 Tax=Dryocola sp. BD626 TaxID=3133273 RepID=UPI003F505EF1
MDKKLKLVFFMSVLFLLSACDKDDNAIEPDQKDSEKLQKFLRKVKSELVFVEGGQFLMGDYGEEYGPEHLPYDNNQDSKPLHKVVLSGFSISKFKVNNELYRFYLSYNKLEGTKIKMGQRRKLKWEMLNSTPDTPAHVDWYEADKYCRWLAEVTQLPFSLPTEAQWEYAARNRGEYVIAPTNDGTIRVDQGEKSNVASEKDSKIFANKMGTSLGVLSPLPGNLYAPNPLGIYDMAGNGFEWMKDWYDPDYYQSSPVNNPQGPDKPVFKDFKGRFTKVTRSQDFSGPGRGLTVVRHFKDPNNDGMLPGDKTVRCVVNSPNPVQ